jgi:hypothetical protein
MPNSKIYQNHFIEELFMKKLLRNLFLSIVLISCSKGALAHNELDNLKQEKILHDFKAFAENKEKKYCARLKTLGLEPYSISPLMYMHKRNMDEQAVEKYCAKLRGLELAQDVIGKKRTVHTINTTHMFTGCFEIILPRLIAVKLNNVSGDALEKEKKELLAQVKGKIKALEERDNSAILIAEGYKGQPSHNYHAAKQLVTFFIESVFAKEEQKVS